MHAVLLSLLLAADTPASTGDAIVPKGAKLELLFTRTAKIQGGLTEGSACAPDGSIYFSDIPLGKDKGMILRFDPKTKETTVFVADSRKSNGLKFDREGRLVACEGADEGGRAVVRYDLKPSNVAFGRGTESKTLYITIDKSLYRIALKVEGYRPE